MSDYRKLVYDHQAAIEQAHAEATVAIMSLVPTSADAAPALAALERLSASHIAAHKWFLDEMKARLAAIEGHPHVLR